MSTSTDVTAYEAPGGVEILSPTVSDDARTQLVRHAETMATAKQLADAMCGSDLVPAIYRGKPANGAAAILYGAELGLNPIQSLQQIFVVHGSPAIYARTMVALVKSRGHKLWTEESTDQSVTVCGQLRGDDHIERSTWTYERARKAGYTSNKKYDTDPQAMLYAKAATEICRKIAPDVLLGIAFSREELELEHYANTPRHVEVQQGWQERLGITSAAEPEPTDISHLQEAPADEQPPTTEQTSDDAVAMATQAQVTKLNILLKEEKLDTREAKLEYLSNTFHRPIGSSKELTRVEAGDLITYLESEQAKEAGQ
ncbi:hypothetical protein GCM10007304_18130 [Rhodococcoides trifolii]|uniref:RecT-like ssDNA binding protein n=1 Tax=Rhodococcoides trifolii TaxID=908250 RepID=A0A917D0C3_9NOCA|nr:hypothetical protein [Rhodococcus trifolii]GGG04403.1 hypothetical protein GCM10007304_18130 [Rhodococcus trifolii]